ncbi:MAG: MBL fold metallo-hydrolase [Bacteroidia bacterium]|nr:MBL fold metallo-hydrolase [Bacteroidia bacterium]
MKKILVVVIALLSCQIAFAQVKNTLDNLETVYKDANVTFRKIDNNTWLGSGNVMSSESMYLLEGQDKAILIDAGTTIPNLDKVVAEITNKPVTLVITHVHPDHAGAVDCFDQVWIGAADTVNIPEFMPNYKGKINYLANGQKIELGGRTIEAYHTPGHTPGSVTFLEVGTDRGFCGDAFGTGSGKTSGGILVFCDLDIIINTCREAYNYFTQKGYKKFYCGHFYGENFMTLERLKHVETFAKEVKAGKHEIKPTSFMTLNSIASSKDFRMRFIK